jgi:uncharacterized protein (TIGR03118 family)
VIQAVQRTDIVSDQAGAMVQDAQLVNAWGLAFSSSGIAWVAANGSGIADIFDANGNHVLSSVTIPPPAGGMSPSAPTGAAFNGTAGALMGDRFVFVTEDGTIAGWQAGMDAVLRVDNSTAGAVYKGVTIGIDSSGNPRLYASNFAAGKVEIYDANYQPVAGGPQAFVDDQIRAGFAPFNVQEIGGLVYVTYAKQDPQEHDDVAGVGNGSVDVFDPDGTLVSRLITGGGLNSPWGLVLAPPGFGNIGGDLLVGNFGDGMINAYQLDSSTGAPSAEHMGVLGDGQGNPIVIDGLWALQPGVAGMGFSSMNLYFTAGPNDENDGVFGQLAVPQASDGGAAPAADGGAKTW